MFTTEKIAIMQPSYSLYLEMGIEYDLQTKCIFPLSVEEWENAREYCKKNYN